MFGHYSYIPAQHHVALESAIRHHSVISTVNAPLLARMYKLALDGLASPVTVEGFYSSSLRAGNVILSSVTEGKTGLWIQLAKVVPAAGADQKPGGPYLTVGQKWAMEQYVPAHGNVSTLMWQ